jgi:hypothetical protein
MTFKGIFTGREGKKAVDLKVIFSPETYMSSRDRPYLEEMSQQLTSSEKGIKGVSYGKKGIAGGNQ